MDDNLVLLIPCIILGLLIYVLPSVDQSSSTYTTLKELDFQACEQMRAQGCSEEEIKNHVEYYDMDYN